MILLTDLKQLTSDELCLLMYLFSEKTGATETNIRPLCCLKKHIVSDRLKSLQPTLKDEYVNLIESIHCKLIYQKI